MAVVVRCPGCRGAAQVGPEAVGLLVVCPRCNDPFLAVEEAALIAPPSKPSANGTPRPPRPRRDRAEPIAPRRRRRGQPDAPEPATPAHDPHDLPPEHAGGVPASVLFGLALLPFAIPLLWLIGPVLLTQPPALSPAAPTALAVAAAALCMAVVYTVDWTPSTRIKGVLMLVGLSYFAGLSLYFLKKDMVDRAKHVFEPKQIWSAFRPPNRNPSYEVQLPAPVNPVPGQPPLKSWQLACYTATARSVVDSDVTFVVGVGPDAHQELPEGEWFAAVYQELFLPWNPLQADPGRPVTSQTYPGREWMIPVPGEGFRERIVRVFRAEGKVYYLSAEGSNIDTDDAYVRQFFQSFRILPQPVNPAAPRAN